MSFLRVNKLCIVYRKAQVHIRQGTAKHLEIYENSDEGLYIGTQH